MGLYSPLNDVSSDSIPILILVLVANFVSYLRSLFIRLLQSVGLLKLDMEDEVGDGMLVGVGSGLAGLVIASEQLKATRVFSYLECGEEGGAADGGGGFDTDCVVCLCGFKKGEKVRRLGCRHLFHKVCLDGWFDQLHWICPLCRFPLLSDDRVAATTERRIARGLVTWFSMR
ncbi:E3 ubiquitin-protein ligase RHA2A-like [Macadamia integrifolia]|uniref:E3 ubiquitin-protein ligase RHA2A-like n=1 Tax=Macadamia integrifolia TaxID=60698 RepID=UPI001C4E64AD|nr:E3 ubiquitin-protein ligase RHA2A-like [Macadamia integrifolia]